MSELEWVQRKIAETEAQLNALCDGKRAAYVERESLREILRDYSRQQAILRGQGRRFA